MRKEKKSSSPSKKFGFVKQATTATAATTSTSTTRTLPHFFIILTSNITFQIKLFKNIPIDVLFHL
jgi:hypothetical protein